VNSSTQSSLSPNNYDTIGTRPTVNYVAVKSFKEVGGCGTVGMQLRLKTYYKLVTAVSIPVKY